MHAAVHCSSALGLFYLFCTLKKFFEKRETLNVNNNGFLVSDLTREMRKNQRDKTHYHRTSDANRFFWLFFSKMVE